MAALNTRVDDRPGDLTAIDTEQRPRRIRLHGRHRSLKRRHRLSVERDLPDEPLGLACRRHLAQEVAQHALNLLHLHAREHFHECLIRECRCCHSRATPAFSGTRLRRRLPLSRPEDEARECQVSVERGKELGPELAGGVGIERALGAGRLWLRHPANCLDHALEALRTLLRVDERREVRLHTLFVPPARHRHDDAQYFLEVQVRGDDAVERRDFRLRLLIRPPHDLLVDRDRDGASRAFPVRCDEQLVRLVGLVGERHPHVAEDRRVLQLTPVVHRTEQDRLDEFARK